MNFRKLVAEAVTSSRGYNRSEPDQKTKNTAIIGILQRRANIKSEIGDGGTLVVYDTTKTEKDIKAIVKNSGFPIKLKDIPPMVFKDKP